MRDLKFLNALHAVPGIGPATLRTLKSKYKTWEAAWNAEETSLKETGISSTALEAFMWKRGSLSPDREMERLIREGIWMLEESDRRFPPALKEIAHSPLILYGKGDVKVFDSAKPCLAVVGTRKPTPYGIEATDYLVRELSPFLTIVSGLATGIDTKAHQAALEKKGSTFAVIGSGHDRDSLFPAENFHLSERIIGNGGLVLSEHPPGTPAMRDHFPRRNRIISGLSRGIAVIEARERSGALITARFALEQGREVFAIPGPIFSSVSSGPNLLIQEGASLVQCAKDILENLGISYTEEKNEARTEALEGYEEKIFPLLGDEPVNVDFIKAQTGLSTQIIVTSLSMLELKGLIKNFGGDAYKKI